MKTCTFFGHRQIWENIDGAMRAKEYAEKLGKRIINIYKGENI